MSRRARLPRFFRRGGSAPSKPRQDEQHPADQSHDGEHPVSQRRRPLSWHDSLFGYRFGGDDADLSFSDTDDAAHAPLGMVVELGFEWGDERRPDVPWDRTVIYETHVRGLTMRHPDVPEQAVRLLLQVYPVRSRGKQAIRWDGALGPVRYPAEALKRARERVPAGVDVQCGLAAYDQRWPGHEPGEAMTMAFQSARDGGARRVRWWSGKHVVRLGARAYSAPAIEALRT